MPGDACGGLRGDDDAARFASALHASVRIRAHPAAQVCADASSAVTESAKWRGFVASAQSSSFGPRCFAAIAAGRDKSVGPEGPPTTARFVPTCTDDVAVCAACVRKHDGCEMEAATVAGAASAPTLLFQVAANPNKRSHRG
ncbi:DUF6053 domain-containing protein [Lysobacter enzymogenes]|uniref:DUF6053 domain-containing protein n=1 Tax=Lysobacter enzymogenes TaxID=69 RepID=UPI003747A768